VRVSARTGAGIAELKAAVCVSLGTPMDSADDLRPAVFDPALRSRLEAWLAGPEQEREGEVAALLSAIRGDRCERGHPTDAGE
jgi:hypothetical protein